MSKEDALLASDIAIFHSFALLGTNISPEKAILKMFISFS